MQPPDYRFRIFPTAERSALPDFRLPCFFQRDYKNHAQGESPYGFIRTTAIEIENVLAYIGVFNSRRVPVLSRKISPGRVSHAWCEMSPKMMVTYSAA